MIRDAIDPPASARPRASGEGWIVAAVCAIGSLVAGAVTYVNALVLKHPYPRNSFLFLPGDRFMDFNNTIRHVRMDDPYSNQTMVYFPGTNVVLWPLKQLGNLLGMLLLFGLLLSVTAMLVFGATRVIGALAPRLVIVAVLLVSYPILFTIDRANFEVLVYVSIAAFGLALSKGRPGWAAVALSVAIGMKVTPGIFAGVFLRKGERRYLALSGGLAAVQMLVGLLLPGPSAATSIHEFRNNLSFYDTFYVAGDNGYAFGHSLFGGLKGAVTLVAGDAARHSFGRSFAPAATVIALLGLAAVAVMLGVVKRPLWWKMTVGTTALLLLTPVSADYRLIHLFVPLSMFLAERPPIPHAKVIAAAFGLLLVPKTVDWSFGSFSPGLGVAFSSVTSAVLLLVIVGLTAAYRPDAEEGSEGSPGQGDGAAARVAPRRSVVSAERAQPA